MKIKLTGQISEMKKAKINNEQVVSIELELDGIVVANTSSGREAKAKMHLDLKPIFANQLKFGDKLYLTLDTEEN